MDNVKLIRSKRRTISVEIKPDLSIVVRAPIKMADRDIKNFIIEKTPWIEKHLVLMKERAIKARSLLNLQPFTDKELKALKIKALSEIPNVVNYYSRLIGVSYSKVSFRKQKTRWGSCSAKGALSFNILLALCPESVVHYVVIHELCHRKQMNHSKRFWAEVNRFCPDYKACRTYLKKQGNEYIKRLP